ncbi:MAG: DUF4070 domain-containing protein, partial [Prochlorococcaceae cyanobacterium]
TRPVEDIAQEYVEAFCQLYEPRKYLDRVHRYFLKLGPARVKSAFKFPDPVVIRALLIVCWRQGIKRSTRWAFWHHLFSILRSNPKVTEQYLAVCAHNEHFMEYREIVRRQIENQLAAYRQGQLNQPSVPSPVKVELAATA